MHDEPVPKPKSARRSLTDWILTLCASGRFGLREAVALATKQKDKSQEPPVQQQEEERKTG
jgi:hypothetical protein